MTNQVNQIKGTLTMKDLINLLSMLKDKEAKLYWVNAMVKQGEINQGQAGYLIIKEGLI